MPEIKHYLRKHVAYVTEVGPYGEAVKRGLDRLFASLAAHHVQPFGPPIGIYYDNPAQVAVDKLRSDLCVPVAPDLQISDGLSTMDLGDSDVATITYQGAQSIQAAYNELYGWLSAQGYRETGAAMETYLSEPGEELRAEVAVPVEKVVIPLALPAMPTEKAAALPAPKRATRKPSRAAPRKPARAAAKKPARKTAKKPVRKAVR